MEQTPTERLQLAQSAVAAWTNTNEQELLCALSGIDDLAAELRELLREWRSASYAFLNDANAQREAVA